MMRVGVAPGTYTMQLGCPGCNGMCGLGGQCPPDETGWYVTPPFGPYGAAEPTVDRFASIQAWNPYQDTPSLKEARGLGDLTLGNVNIGILTLMFGAVVLTAGAIGLFAHRK